MLLAWRMQLARPSWLVSGLAVADRSGSQAPRHALAWREKRTVIRQPAETIRGVTNASRVCAATSCWHHRLLRSCACCGLCGTQSLIGCDLCVPHLRPATWLSLGKCACSGRCKGHGVHERDPWLTARFSLALPLEFELSASSSLI